MTASVEPRPISRLATMFLYSAVMGLRPLLRPSARKDLAEYLDKRVLTKDDAVQLAEWARSVLSAHRVDAKELRKGRAARAVQSDPLRVFRRPERAYRPRKRL